MSENASVMVPGGGGLIKLRDKSGIPRNFTLLVLRCSLRKGQLDVPRIFPMCANNENLSRNRISGQHARISKERSN